MVPPLLSFGPLCTLSAAYSGAATAVGAAGATWGAGGAGGPRRQLQLEQMELRSFGPHFVGEMPSAVDRLEVPGRC